MNYTAMDWAIYIVKKCIEDHHPISNLQLQKILYFIQREYLKTGKGPAFVDDFEAWQFGPVVPAVYYNYCGNGALPISMEFNTPSIQSEDISNVRSIIEHLRNLDPWLLVEATHKPGGAWDQIFQNGAGNHQIIPIDLIRKAG